MSIDLKQKNAPQMSEAIRHAIEPMLKRMQEGIDAIKSIPEHRAYVTLVEDRIEEINASLPKIEQAEKSAQTEAALNKVWGEFFDTLEKTQGLLGNKSPVSNSMRERQKKIIINIKEAIIEAFDIDKVPGTNRDLY